MIRSPRGAACLFTLLLGACATLGPAPPAPLPIPGASEAMDEARSLQRSATPEALERSHERALEAAILAPDWVLPQRFLDDWAVRELRGPEALRRHLEVLARDPHDGSALYLAGRLEGAAGRERFERAIRADDSLGWGHHGLAFLLSMQGDQTAALARQEQALRRAREPGEYVYFLLAQARILRWLGRTPQALERLERELAEGAPLPSDRVALELELARTELGTLVGTLANRGYERALAILRRRDLSEEELHSLVLTLLRSAPSRDRRLETLELTRALAARPGPGRDLLFAQLLVELEPSPLASALLVRAQRDLGRIPGDDRTLRAARFALGDIGPAVESWLSQLPPEVLAADGLPRWPALRELVRAARALDPAPDARDLSAFGETLLAAGWFTEARGLTQAMAGLDLDAALELESRAAAALALLGGLSQLVESLDAPLVFDPDALPPPARGEGSASEIEDLDDLLAAAELLFQGFHDEQAERRRQPWRRVELRSSPSLNYGPAATVVHPGPLFSALDEERGRGAEGEPVPGLAHELAALGRFGIFGQALGGGGPDATVLRVISVDPIEGQHLGTPFRGEVAICEATDVVSRPVRLGAAIAGAAVHEGYWIDLDEVRRERDEWLVLQRRFFPADRAGDTELAERALAGRGLPLTGIERPVGEGWRERSRLVPLLGEGLRVRLAILAERFARHGGEAPLVTLQELLDAVAVHEQGHLCDRTRYLPVSEHWLELIGFAIRSGLSPTAVAQRLEYRAQLTALCVSAEPRLALAESLIAAENGGTGLTPHAGAYRQLVTDFLEQLDRQLETEPEAWRLLDEQHYLAHQLHCLEPDQIRAVAMALAVREGLR